MKEIHACPIMSMCFSFISLQSEKMFNMQICENLFFDRYVRLKHFVIPPDSNTFSDWTITYLVCHGSKFKNSLGRTKLNNSLGKQQLELSIRTLSDRTGKFVYQSA